MYKAKSGTHPDVKTRETHWVEKNGQPLRMPQGGVVTYRSREEAEFAARCMTRKARK